MKNLKRVLLSCLLGGIVCALLSAIMFALAVIVDGSTPAEAFTFAIIVGVIGAIVGGLIGFVIGIGNLNLLGGGIVGILTTVAVLAVYVSVYSRPGEYGYFLSEARVLLFMSALPTLLTGMLTAWLKNVINRT